MRVIDIVFLIPPLVKIPFKKILRARLPVGFGKDKIV
jgi:hypothetical protein